jgi:hypothetical protein
MHNESARRGIVVMVTTGWRSPDTKMIKAATAPGNTVDAPYAVRLAGTRSTAPELSTALWDGEPPPSVETSLRVLVSRVRKTMFEAGAGQSITRRSPRRPRSRRDLHLRRCHPVGDRVPTCTGTSRPAPLHNELGGIRMRGTQVAAEPRVHLVGFGPSQSTVGANRGGRAAVREAIARLDHLASPPLRVGH